MEFEGSLVGWILEVKMSQNWNHNWIKNGVEKRLCLGGGMAERTVDMVVQGSSKSKIIILFNSI